MKKKVLITSGGTGGHIYPAVSLVEKLTRESDEIEFLFAGGKLSENRFFLEKGYPFRTIDCGKWVKNPLLLGSNLIRICRGVFQSFQIFRQFTPDLVVGFGSYHTFPMLVAAYLSSIPFILHEANSMPGKVNRLLSKHALSTGIFFPEAASLLKGNIVPMKIPLRQESHYNYCSKEEARLELGLDPSMITVLVFGGSQGAQILNKACSKAAGLVSLKSWQVLHLTGYGEDIPQIVRNYEKAGVRCTVKPFEHRMHMAWKAADFACVRAGAGTIAEALEFEVPLILIPYPYATDNHQEKNADFIMKRIGGGFKIKESDASSTAIAARIQDWLHAPEKLIVMQNAIRSFKQNYRWKELSQCILEELQIWV